MLRHYNIFVAVLLAVLLQACGSTSDEHVEAGRELLDERDFRAAILEFKAALKKDAKHAEARGLLGEAYYEIQEFESADKELTRALELNPELHRSRVVSRLAQTLLYLADYGRLDKLQIGGLDPESRSRTLAAKALARLYQGDEVAAEEILAAAEEGKDVPRFTRLASARLSLAKGNFEQAKKKLDQLILSSGDYVPAWNLAGDIYAAQRQPLRAEKAYSVVLKHEPRMFDARLNRSMMHIYLRNFSAAREDLQTLEKLHRAITKDHPGFHFAQGILLMQRGAYKQARKAFEKTADYSFAYPLAYYYMAVIDLEQGSHERALGEIYRFLQLAPESVAGPKLAARLELLYGGYHTAEQLLMPIVKTYPKDVEALNLLANAKLGLGKGGQGVDLLARAAHLQPKSVVAKTRLGAGYFATGEIELGIEILEKTAANESEFEQADILLVLNYLREERLQEAIAAAQEYKNRHPGSATSYNLLGRAFFADNQLKEARWAYKKALDLDATDLSARHGLAEIAIAKGDYRRARDLYNRVLKYNEDDLETQLKMAASWALEGDEEIMRTLLEIAIDDHPESMQPLLVLIRYYLAAGRLREAEPLVAKLIAVERDQPDALATIAGYQLATDQYHLALLTLERLLTIRPSVSQYHYMMSKAYAGLGETENSLLELVIASEMDPEHLYAKLALARLMMARERWNRFEQHFEELKKIAPQNPDVMQLEVVLATRRGDDSRVAQLLWGIYALIPTTENLLALVNHRLAHGDGAKAVELLRDWISASPQDIDARLKLAQTYNEMGSAEKSWAEYRAIIAIDDDNLAALNNLAWDLRDSRPREALRYAQRAHNLSPESVPVLDTLGMVFLKLGRFEEASRALERAVALEPDNLEVRFHQAQMRYAQGDHAATRETLVEILADEQEFESRGTATALLEFLDGSQDTL